MGRDIVKFRYGKFVCDGAMICYPQIRDADGNNVWDSRYPPNAPGNDMAKYGMRNGPLVDTVYIDFARAEGVNSGTKYKLGVDVVNGDDCWTGGEAFLQFDSQSDQMVTIRKYGGERDGDVTFEGAQQLQQGLQIANK